MNLQFLCDTPTIKSDVLAFIEQWNSPLSYFESNSSGSTGVPKTIEIEKKHAIASAQSTLSFLGIRKNQTALLCLNCATIGGKMMLVRSLIHDLNLLVVDPKSNPLKNVNETIDFIAIAPIQLHTILEEDAGKLKKIPHIIVGGGVISQESIALLRAHKITVYQTFGMTETISHIALRKVGFETESVYTTVKDVTVSTQNDQLHIHAPHLGIVDLATNDRIELISNTEFRWLGRTDFVINSGGYKLQMEEIEKELAIWIHIPFFVYKLPHEKLGEQIVLILEGDETAYFTKKKIYDYLSNPYFRPLQVAFTPHFIRTQSDKINRLATFNTIDEHSFKQIL